MTIIESLYVGMSGMTEASCDQDVLAISRRTRAFRHGANLVKVRGCEHIDEKFQQRVRANCVKMLPAYEVVYQDIPAGTNLTKALGPS